MASNYGSDQEMERALREHFEAEAEELRAPQNLWESIEDQMDLQPTRHPVTQVRRKILGALKQNWFPMMATGGAVAVAASAVFLASRATQDEFGVSESYCGGAAGSACRCRSTGRDGCSCDGDACGNSCRENRHQGGSGRAGCARSPLSRRCRSRARNPAGRKGCRLR